MLVLHVDRPHVALVFGRVGLSEEVSKVGSSWAPGDDEVSLPGAVSDPVESHVGRLGPLLFHGAVGDSDSALVI